jgi:hypothetical protein
VAGSNLKDLPSRIKKNISDALQYSSLYWSNHLCFAPDGGDQHVLGWLKKFSEGLHPVLWIEVLSIMEMVPVGAPSLRRVISWVKVSTLQPTISLDCELILICFRMLIRLFWKKLRTFIISSSPSIHPFLSVPHIPIFQQHPSSPHSHPYQPCSAHHLLNASR